MTCSGASGPPKESKRKASKGRTSGTGVVLGGGVAAARGGIGNGLGKSGCGVGERGSVEVFEGVVVLGGVKDRARRATFSRGRERASSLTPPARDDGGPRHVRSRRCTSSAAERKHAVFRRLRQQPVRAQRPGGD
jgi:hypothetical protein